MTSPYPKLVSPAAVPELVASGWISIDGATKEIVRVIRKGILRPSDIVISEPQFFYAPFWRVIVAVDNFQVGDGTVSGQRRRRSPLPHRGARQAVATILVSARSAVPFAPKIPSTLGRFGPSPAPEILLTDLIYLGLKAAPGDLVEADVPREHAERTAARLLLRKVHPGARCTSCEPRIVHTILLYYPLFLATYRYADSARHHAEEEFFVLLDGRTGKIVASKHPSAARALATKLRRLSSRLAIP
jgi:hypothetical protein